jgi:hypothetical protein
LPEEDEAAAATEENESNRPTITHEKGRVVDFSACAPKLRGERYILGKGFSVQIGKVNFKGSRKWSYPAIIFTRDPTEPTEEEKKKARKEGKELEKKRPFNFNIPSSILGPVIDALLTIRGDKGDKTGE